jgi:hypothetical protein
MLMLGVLGGAECGPLCVVVDGDAFKATKLHVLLLLLLLLLLRLRLRRLRLLLLLLLWLCLLRLLLLLLLGCGRRGGGSGGVRYCVQGVRRFPHGYAPVERLHGVVVENGLSHLHWLIAGGFECDGGWQLRCPGCDDHPQLADFDERTKVGMLYGDHPHHLDMHG